MATELQVTCIRKSDRTNVHERIISIGCATVQGTKVYTHAEAIRAIENGSASFYVQRSGKKAKVVIAISAHGYKYLKTEGDDTTSNNLLSLPEC